MTSRFVFAACMLLLVALPSCVWSSAEKAQTDEERLLVLAAKETLETMNILAALRAGQTNAAIDALEFKLDRGVVLLGDRFGWESGETDHRVHHVLSVLHTYRAKWPRVVSEDSVRAVDLNVASQLAERATCILEKAYREDNNRSGIRRSVIMAEPRSGLPRNYESLRFEYERATRLRDWQRAKWACTEILGLIPDENDPRHIAAKRNLAKLQLRD